MIGQSVHGNPPAAGGTVNRDYRPLIEWANARGCKVVWNPASRDVLVTRGTSRIALQIDSSRITVDGVSVWLSHPVVRAASQILVANRDAQGVLDPLAHPPRSPKRIRTICLDAGHGGKEPGQRSGQRLEKNFTLALAEEVRKQLVAAGFKVVMTRPDDSFVELTERPEIARRAGADLFVSLHYNAAADARSDAGGVEVYALTPEGARSTNISNDLGSLAAAAGNESDPENLFLAYCLQRSLTQQLPGTNDRGVRRARFLVLRLARMPAVLVEAGFMSNAGDSRWIYSSVGRNKAAAAIVDGIRKYQKATEIIVPPEPVRTTQLTQPRSKPRAGTSVKR